MFSVKKVYNPDLATEKAMIDFKGCFGMKQ